MGKLRFILQLPIRISIIRIVICFGASLLVAFPIVWGQESFGAEADFDYLLEDFEGDFVHVPGYGNIPSSWEAGGSQNVTFSKGSDAHHGGFCLHAHVTNDPKYYSVLEKKFFFKPGTVLNLRVQVNPSTTGERAQARLDASYEDPPGTWHAYRSTHFFYPSSSGWRPISVEGIKIPLSGELRIRLMLHHDTLDGSTDFDLDCLSMSMMGDINGDGNVDLTDAILTLKVLVGIEPNSNVNKEADVNGEGVIGLAEVLYVLQNIAGLR